MASVPDLMQTYIWLVDVLQRSNGISLSEINEQWVRTSMSGGLAMHRNTFYSHKKGIEKMYGIEIVCDHRVRGCKYSISTKSLIKNPLAKWMLNTLAVANMVKEAQELRERIVLEQIPTGDKMLLEATRAMTQGVTLKLQYRKFVDTTAYIAEVEPYCIKLFRQRWYLLAHRIDRSYLAIYAFDRMERVQATKNAFELPEDFDANKYFTHLFGVYQAQEGLTLKPIILRTYNGEWNYLRTLPLHHTQEEIAKTEEYVDFKFLLYPTPDFKLELLSRGENVEVLKPAALRADIAKMTKAAARRYSRKTNTKTQKTS